MHYDQMSSEVVIITGHFNLLPVLILTLVIHAGNNNADECNSNKCDN